MNSQLFWRSLLAQVVCAGLPFAVLVALPLPEDLFEDYGFIVGPAVWLAAAFVASRFIPAPTSLVMFSALAGLVAGTIVMLVTSHTAGGIVALLVFAASCAGYDEGREAVGAGAGRGGDEDRAA
ncbi:MAG: hypothetical protein WD844_08195 [Thermoleophilaceae bacterium]